MANEKEQLALVRAADEYLAKKEQQLTRWVQGGVAAEALRRFAVLEMQQDWKLRRCTPRSIYTALLACATTGLVPGSLRGEAYLVPFNRNIAPKGQKEEWVAEAKFLAGYKGLRKQALRTPVVKMIKSSCVYEAELDSFDIDLGTRNEIIHKPLLTGGDRGQVVGAYAWAQLSGGHRQIVWMSRADLDKVKAFATRKVASPAWNDWPERMYEKTAVRGLCGQLPMGDDYFNGVRIEAQHDGVEDAPSAEEVIDIITEGEVSREVGEEMSSALFAGVPAAAEQARHAGPTPEVRTNPPAQTPAAAAAPANRNRQTNRSRPPIDVQPGQAQSSQSSPSNGSAGTSNAGAANSPTPSGQPSGSQAAPAATSQTTMATGSPTSPTPTTSSAGSSSSPASAPSPVATSAGSPSAAPTGSPASTAAPQESSAAGQASSPSPSPSPSPEEDEVTFGDVAAEPAEGEGFDTSFGEQQQPDRRGELMTTFRSWCATHTDRETVRANSEGWMSIFRAWLVACGSRAELMEDKDEWINWTALYYKASARANPAKGIKEFVGDPEMDTVQSLYTRRRGELL
jgi:phage RecT family recombinase